MPNSTPHIHFINCFSTYVYVANNLQLRMGSKHNYAGSRTHQPTDRNKGAVTQRTPSQGHCCPHGPQAIGSPGMGTAFNTTLRDTRSSQGPTSVAPVNHLQKPLLKHRLQEVFPEYPNKTGLDLFPPALSNLPTCFTVPETKLTFQQYRLPESFIF